jgi:hypothetical protein
MQVYNDELYHFGVKGMKWKKNGETSISKDEYRSFTPNYVISRKPLTDEYHKLRTDLVDDTNSKIIRKIPVNDEYRRLKQDLTDNRILRKTPVNNTESKNTTKSIIPIKTMIPINSTPEQTKAIKEKLAKQGYIVSGQNIVKKLYNK